MTENEDCRRSGRDRRISTKLAAFYETERSFKKNKSLTNWSPPSTSVLKEPPKKKKTISPVLPKSKQKIVIQPVEPVLPDVSDAITVVTQPIEMPTTSKVSESPVSLDNTPLVTGRPKREHRSSRRLIEAFESSSLPKCMAPPRLSDQTASHSSPRSTNNTLQLNASADSCEANENDLYADEVMEPSPKKRRLNGSSGTMHFAIKKGRPSQIELQEYREFVISRGGNPDNPLPQRWRHEMAQAKTEVVPLKRKLPQQRTPKKAQSMSSDACGPPKLFSLSPIRPSLTLKPVAPTIKTDINVKKAIVTPTVTPVPAPTSSTVPPTLTVLPTAATSQGVPLKYVKYTQRRQALAQALQSKSNPLMPRIINPPTPQPDKNRESAPKPQAVIRFLRPAATPSSILKGAKVQPPPPVKPKRVKSVTPSVAPAKPSVPSETVSFAAPSFVTFPNCAVNGYTGLQARHKTYSSHAAITGNHRMYIPFQPDVEYCLVNQNGELLCDEIPDSPPPIEVPTVTHRTFEVQPNCTLTVL